MLGVINCQGSVSGYNGKATVNPIHFAAFQI